ncbi:MAG: hypothetical protein HY960_12895 [Ignavibacteriae bacterium]|nr:hypothetical protein [Ignavibacteriota bacterium]
MKEVLCVFTSDSINLYFQKFSTGSLVSALSDRWDSGIPMHISHDITRLAGWGRPTMVYFEPGLTRLVGLNILPETDIEIETVITAQRLHISEHINKICSPDLVYKLNELIKEHLQGNEIPFETNCVTLYRKNLAKEVFPELFNLSDKDSLISTSELKYMGQGLFEKNGLLLFAHPWYRRSNTRLNTLNTAFLDLFFSVIDKYKSHGSIALDSDLVGLSSTQQKHLEHEYWWGPKFSNDLVTIPIGVTRHETSKYERLFHSISSTEFWWQSRDGQHILEIEELKNRPVLQDDGSSFYGCRYVHSIVDEKTRNIIHLDGAIRGYNEDEMVLRLDKKINEAGKQTLYTKLWRLDIPIGIEEWKRLISDYFRDNHLIGEYFGINPEEKDGRPVVLEKEDPSDVILKYVPYSIKKGTGFRVSVSFHYLDNHPTEYLEIVPTDTVTVDNTTLTVVSTETIELRKICARNNVLLQVQDSINFIAFEDLYTDFPLIKIPFNNTKNNLDKLLNTFRQLINAFVSKNQDRIVSFVFGLPLSDRELRIAFVGPVADILSWLNSPLSFLPFDLETLQDWSDKMSYFLSSEFKTISDCPKLTDIYQSSGIFFLKRTPLPPSEYEVLYSKEKKGLVYELRIHPTQDDLGYALQEEKLAICSSFFITSSECSICHSEYRTCPCSKYLDGGGQIVKKCEHAFAYISDRPAFIRKE